MVRVKAEDGLRFLYSGPHITKILSFRKRNNKVRRATIWNLRHGYESGSW